MRQAQDPDTSDQARALLERELYWAAPPVTSADTERERLGTPWAALATGLDEDLGRLIPLEEQLDAGPRIKRPLKRFVFRATRPVGRRYDRIAGDVAKLGEDLARHVDVLKAQMDEVYGLLATIGQRVEALSSRVHDASQLGVWVPTVAKQVESLATQVARLEGKAHVRPPPAVAGDPPHAEPVVPDAFYWHFEASMRGSIDSVRAKLAQYEPIAAEIRDRHASIEGAGPPLWIDLGCGDGTFALMLQEWGWRVRGVDISDSAVEACRARGVEAEVGTLPGYLFDFDGERPLVMSAIQVIEHLPVGQWVPFFQASHEVLPPGGTLMVETINPINPQALASNFFADLTHTWPGHPETLSLMAEFAGFSEIEVRYENPDEHDQPQDYAMLATKANG